MLLVIPTNNFLRLEFLNIFNDKMHYSYIMKCNDTNFCFLRNNHPFSLKIL